MSREEEIRRLVQEAAALLEMHNEQLEAYRTEIADKQRLITLLLEKLVVQDESNGS
jgi:hypothetical protein